MHSRMCLHFVMMRVRLNSQLNSLYIRLRSRLQSRISGFSFRGKTQNIFTKTSHDKMLMLYWHLPRSPSEVWHKPRGPGHMPHGEERPGPVCSHWHIYPEDRTHVDSEILQRHMSYVFSNEIFHVLAKSEQVEYFTHQMIFQQQNVS